MLWHMCSLVKKNLCVTTYVVNYVRQLGAAAPEGGALKTDVRRGRAVCHGPARAPVDRPSAGCAPRSERTARRSSPTSLRSRSSVEKRHLTRPKQHPTGVASLCVTAQVPEDV